MTLSRCLALLLATACIGASAALAADPCTEVCQALLREGQVLQTQARFGQAFEKFEAASRAAPTSSVPLSLGASLLYHLSTAAKGDEADKLRTNARTMARKAYSLAPGDPVAQEILRQLDDAPTPLHALSPDLAQRHIQAERLFAEQRYAEALQAYEALMRADPAFSQAWVGAGDCWYMQRDLPRAEALFRRATEIEPVNAQAWRFLSDALLGQGKRAAAENALLSGIAADPAQRLNWDKLAALRAADGLALQHLQFQRGSRVVRNADGTYAVEIEERVGKQAATPDGAFRLALAVAEANKHKENDAVAKEKRLSAYEIELDAWRTALKVADELKTNTGKDLLDPALLRMQAFARDDQLEPAILLLHFRQAYRPALAAWSAAHPGGLKGFIDRYGIQP